MIRRLAPLALLLATLTAPPAPAQSFGETVMAPGHLAQLPPGAAMTFRHSRHLPAAAEDASAPKGGYARLTAQSPEDIELISAEGERLILTIAGRRVADFSSKGPNPVLLMFLENVMRTVAQETGGNPHYIRNRMRMTLGAAETAPDRLVIAPFAEDPNRSRFGDFADLRLEFDWEADAPGRLTRLVATLPAQPERYTETLIAAASE